MLNLQKLTDRTTLTKNTLYSLIGQGLPIIIAIFSIPLLIKGMGTDRFGILTLAWMVISYFSLFDLGLGRAVTQLVAEKIGTGEEKQIPELVWTASIIMFFLGIVGGLIVAFISKELVFNILKVPVYLRTETLNSFYLLAACIPIITSTAGHIGILSAIQRFDLINIVKTPMSIFIFIGPLLVLPWQKNLFFVILVLTFSRAVAWLIYTVICLRAIPDLKRKVRFNRSLLKPLLKFGGWMTITNVIGPLLVYLDRFLIGTFISVEAVAYYTTPYEIVTKLWIIPTALVGVLFPAFSASYIHNKSHSIRLLSKSKKYIFIAIFPLSLFIITFAKIGLDIWIGKDFAANSTTTLRWLAAGVFLNSIAQVSYAFIQGIGRPDITAKIHIVQLPFYLALLQYLMKEHGISGAACAWFLRILIDTIMMDYGIHKILGEQTNLILKNTFFSVLFGLGIFFFGSFLDDFLLGFVFCSSIISSGIFILWKYILSNDERLKICSVLIFLNNKNS
jgi:O-antigen/teichoic acid export membrane protein